MDKCEGTTKLRRRDYNSCLADLLKLFIINTSLERLNSFLFFYFKDFACHMVQKGEAKLECDEDCNTHKMKHKKETTKEEELRKQEELRAQQVMIVFFL